MRHGKASAARAARSAEAIFMAASDPIVTEMERAVHAPICSVDWDLSKASTRTLLIGH